MNVKDTVVVRFQKLCAERNITINKLANLSGVTPLTVYSMIDKRRREISIVTIKKLCDGLDVSLNEIKFIATDAAYKTL